MVTLTPSLTGDIGMRVHIRVRDQIHGLGRASVPALGPGLSGLCERGSAHSALGHSGIRSSLSTTALARVRGRRGVL